MLKNKQLDECFQPVHKGYQPKPTVPADFDEPKPQGGYSPTGSGDNPGNPPKPPESD